MTNLMTAAIEISGEAINENNEVVVITGEHNLLDVRDLASNMASLKDYLLYLSGKLHY